MATPNLPRQYREDFCLNAIKNLKLGVPEIIVHLAHDDAEVQAITLGHPDMAQVGVNAITTLLPAQNSKRLSKRITLCWCSGKI